MGGVVHGPERVLGNGQRDPAVRGVHPAWGYRLAWSVRRVYLRVRRNLAILGGADQAALDAIGEVGHDLDLNPTPISNPNSNPKHYHEP